jgi:hypothetical protein
LRLRLLQHAAVAAHELRLPAHGAERELAARVRPAAERPNLEPDGVGTTQANDWGDKAVTGQSCAVASRSGDWVAIWYGGKMAWLQDPAGKNTVPGSGTLVTPRAGLSSIPVYGRAYPEDILTATLGYTIPAGQVYVAKDLVGADYYDATTFDALDTYRVFTGSTRFYEISFNHRIAFVRTSDVEVVD